MALAVSDANYKWNNATIPILIDASVYSNQQGLNVHDAIQEFNTKSVLCLIPWTDEKEGGFQNYFHANYGAGNVLGNYLLTTDVAEYRNVPQGHLGYPRSDDIRQLFTAVNDYAFRNGYLGGFPTFQIADYGRGTVYGVILIRKEAGEWRDVVLAQMPR